MAEEPSATEDEIVFATQPHAVPSRPDVRLLQKRDKVAALDMRFQRFRKAEP